MKLTYNWLRDYCPCELLPEELARRLSMSGTLVEEIVFVDAHPQPIDAALRALRLRRRTKQST